MAAKEFTLLFYYVPQDKDDLDAPNAFGIAKSMQNLILADVQEKFPLAGRYYFRFKYKHNDEYVWLDLVNPNCKIPSVDGHVFIKATRISWFGTLGSSHTQTTLAKRLLQPQQCPRRQLWLRRRRLHPQPQPQCHLRANGGREHR